MNVLRVIFLILVFATIISARNLHDWETITYMNDITDLIYTDGQIWASTTGGVFRFNLTDSSSVGYTNIDGLGSLTLSSIEKDLYGHLLAASSDGTINLYDPVSDEWQADFNLSGTEIVDLFVNVDTLWAATKKGVAVFFIRPDHLEFRDYYNNLPLIPKNAYRIAVFSGRVYYATEDGLLHAPSNFVKYNLKLSEAWQLLTKEEGLPSNSIRDLVPVPDSLFIATGSGVA